MNDLSRSVFQHREDLLADLTAALDSGWFLLGPRTTAFAAELASYLGVPHVVPVGNGTDALEIAMKALMPAGRVTVLCAANAGGYGSVAARRAGFDVTYADVDPATHCLDPDDLAARITDEVGVVVVTHLYGRAAEVDPIVVAAHAVGALVLEDCAQALGGNTPAGRVGSLADAATFSFYPTKNLGALGDGGAVATSSDEVAEKVRRLHQYGWDSKYRIADDGGRNSRLDELQAAVLSRRLPLLDDWNSARRAVISAYLDAAPEGVRILPAADESHTGHLAVVETDHRDALRAHLESAHVRTDVHYPIPDHQQPGSPESVSRSRRPSGSAHACCPCRSSPSCAPTRSRGWLRHLRPSVPDLHQQQGGPRYSVVIPVYGNRATLPEVLSRLASVADQLPGELEAVFVVDGSPDDSADVLAALVPQQHLVAQVLEHSRNFGSFAAIRTGLAAARGDFVGVMAADLQEPPEVMLGFFGELESGSYDVAVGRRASRSDPGGSALMSKVFWGLYRRTINRDIPPGGVDVFACTRDVAQRLVLLDESHTSLVALLYWVGFRRVEVPYDRLARTDGTSGWTLRKKVMYLSDSVFAFTRIPIHALTALGVVGTLITLVVGLVVLVSWLAGRIDSPGYTPLMLTILFSTFLLLTGMGVLGSYVWRTYENTKRRPPALTRTHWIHDPRPHYPKEEA